MRAYVGNKVPYTLHVTLIQGNRNKPSVGHKFLQSYRRSSTFNGFVSEISTCHTNSYPVTYFLFRVNLCKI